MVVDEAASLGVDEEVMAREEIGAEEWLGNVSDEEHPVKRLPQAEGESQHLLAVGSDAAAVGRLKVQTTGSPGAVGGCGREDAELRPCVHQEA